MSAENFDFDFLEATSLCEADVTKRMREQRQFLCASCGTVGLTRECGCEAPSCVPYMDMRPLQLGPTVRTKILELMDEAIDSADQTDDLSYEHTVHTEYLPFLAHCLNQTQLADMRVASGGGGYRSSTLSDDEIIALIIDQRLPAK